MNTLSEAIRLITQPPGDLVYFLVTLFALQQALFYALTARRSAVPQAKRWTWAVGGILAGRGLLIVLALLANVKVIAAGDIIPPVEHWVNFISLALIIWGMLSTYPARWQTGALAVLLGFSLLFYAYCAYTWPAMNAANQSYNGSAQEIVWGWVSMVLSLGGIAILLLLRPPEWEWYLVTLGFWVGGAMGQRLMPNPQMNISGWIRLATLVTYPLLALTIHRQLFSPSASVSASPSAKASAARDQEGSVLPDTKMLEDMLAGVEAARDVEPALIVASSRIAKLLDVEVCAIALAEREESLGFRVVAVHPPTAAQIKAPVLAPDAYPILAEVWETQQVQAVSSPQKSPWLKTLYQQLGLEDVGPLSVVPITQRGEKMGLLLLGNPQRQHSWQAQALQVQHMATVLLAHAISYARTQAGAKPLLSRMREQGETTSPSQDHTTQQEIATLKARLSQISQDLDARDQQISRLQQQLEAQSQQSSDVELEFWKNEVQELARDREVLVKERNRLAEELADAKAKLEDLTEDCAVLKRSLQEKESGNRTTAAVQHAQVERERLTQELVVMKDKFDSLLKTRDALQKRCTQLQRALDLAKRKQNNLAGASGEQESTGIAVGLLVTDEDGDITMADALARQLLRLPSGDIAGISVAEIYPDPKWATIVKELLSTKPNARRRARLTLDATGTTLEVDLATLIGHDAKPDGLAITLHTEESSVEKYAAIAGIADEFRTPITAVTGYTDLLLSEQAGILTEMQQQFLERVKANIEQMGNLFNDLLTFTAPNNHPVKFELQPLDVVDVLKEAIRGLSARFKERHLGVRLKVPRDGLEPVRANYDILYQIVLRLISNAALCSQEGTEVLITARQETLADIDINNAADINQPPNENRLKNGKEPIQYIHISVTDTGGGIAQEDLSRVFRHIYRARQPLIQGMGETGVGMAVAKTLVETVGGRIWVESEVGKGSTFSFILPIDTNNE